jgi:hypothetical protein
MERIFDTSGPRANVTMNCGVHWAVILKVLITAPRAKLHDTWGTDAKGFQLLSDDVLRHVATQVLN